MSMNLVFLELTTRPGWKMPRVGIFRGGVRLGTLRVFQDFYVFCPASSTVILTANDLTSISEFCERKNGELRG